MGDIGGNINGNEISSTALLMNERFDTTELPSVYDFQGQKNNFDFDISSNSELDNWHSWADFDTQHACRCLYFPEQIEDNSSGIIPDNEIGPLQQALRWTKEFIAKPHAELGRAGAVCPYVKPAMREKLMYLTVCHLSSEFTTDEIFSKVVIYGDIFLRMEPTEGDLSKLKTIVIVLPDISEDKAHRFMAPVHQRLKSELLKQNMLIGQFYPGCPVPGSWNNQFLPLQSPVSMFAIRTLIESDWRFLKGNSQWEELFKSRFGAEKAVMLSPDIQSWH